MGVNELKKYEGIFITKSALNDEIAKKLLAQIEVEISKNGGSIDKIENWGKKGLAYSIKKNKEGVYYKVDFTITPDKISNLKDTYRLNEDILKVVVIKK